MSDLIIRADAINALGEEPEIWNDTEEEWAYRNAWVEHISAIKSLPSADRPTGEWIEVDCYESEKHSVTDMRCSLCGKYASVVLPHRTRCVYNYCPNCGARMYKGGDSDG